MLIRASIVLLLVLNLGVALWWVSRPAAAPAEDIAPLAGGARLQLVSETDADGSTASSPDPASAGPGATASVDAARCFAFGPYADESAAEAAAIKLQPLVLDVRARAQPTGTPRSWRVYLPAYPTIAETEAVAARVVAAGFKDHYVVRDGAAARSLALGMYRSESAARDHVAALQAAGFPARMAGTGSGPLAYWLDTAAGAQFDADAATALVEAGQRESIDCERFVAPLAPTEPPAPPAPTVSSPS